MLPADGGADGVGGASRGLAQQVLELGEHLVDGVFMMTLHC